ncbi:MAG: aminoacyl-tRNA hydrolase [Spirochaetales bacterium]|jgi:PTH1 family peptidyl-tRNA hydrolase|nr:aminoacyl-tRNA hydrolase [Spirochaetales bacterium]
MVKLFVFLGNPGAGYRFTRHNLAWLALENFAPAKNLSWKAKFKGEFALVPGSGGDKRIFLKPGTFMNLSGQCLSQAAGFFKVCPREILVVHDDTELALGKFQLRLGGGLGGHNGLRSLAAQLGTGGFYRLRLGIGRPARGDLAGFVLGRFSPQEEEELKKLYPKIESLLTALLAGEPEEENEKGLAES